MDKKSYSEAILEITYFDKHDVIATSTDERDENLSTDERDENLDTWT